MSHVHRIEVPIPFPVKWVNCYYIEDSLPTLVNTSVNTAEGLAAIALGLKEHGAGLESIRRIILTHGHLDHSGLAGRIAGTAGADLFVHPRDWSIISTADAERIEGSKESFHAFFDAAGLPEPLIAELIQLIMVRSGRMISVMSGQKPLKHGDVFAFDDFDLEVIHTPGHTPGSVCLFNRKDGSLFSGDAVYEEVTCNPLFGETEPDGSGRYRALPAHRESLDVIRSLPVSELLPGHGVPYSRHHQRIQRIQAYQDRRRNDILNVLATSREARGTTEFLVASSLFPGFRGIEVFHRVCAVRVHMEVLEAQGLVEVSRERSARLYRLRDQPLVGQ